MTTTVTPGRTKIRKKTAAGCVAGLQKKMLKHFIRRMSIVYKEIISQKHLI